MGTLRRCDRVCSHVLQREYHVNAPEHEYPVLHLDFPSGHRRQLLATRRDLARLQRAAKGAEESAPCRGDHIIDGGAGVPSSRKTR